MRRVAVVLVSVLALVLTAAAQADGGGIGVGVSLGGDGVVSPDGTTRYVAVATSGGTVVQAIRTKDGRVTAFGNIAGAFGVPLLGADGTTGGLSRDGKTLVLAQVFQGGPTLPDVSHFAVYNPKRLDLPNEILLRGALSFDALSPNGQRLYLIQHLSAQNLSRYVVRAYDLQRGRLLPGRIADRTQKDWVMQGYAMTRVTTDDGRWAYTLYQNPGGTPFIHALDTVRGVAHCIGIPWQTNDQSALWNVRLTPRDGGKRLTVHWRSGRPWLDVNTSTWRISAANSSFPWLLVAAAIAAAFALAALGVYSLRALRQRVPQELAKPLAVDG
jgi:hypothetical protein